MSLKLLAHPGFSIDSAADFQLSGSVVSESDDERSVGLKGKSEWPCHRTWALLGIASCSMIKMYI